ncbi:DUF5666 domain-containing protein [Acidocella sp.]|uniref:DUF5666 domain-containing protein n=1 Tax=Acidocella sp. TaxID=50710 RepID=UPI003CFCFCEA
MRPLSPWLGLFLLLTACDGAATGPQATREPATPTSLPPKPVQCRVGPHDGPMLAERGIGGTGLPSMAPSSVQGGPKKGTSSPADKGISGTGLPAKPVSTGIAGEITGFASICVNGVEVKYNSATPVLEDGTPAGDQALRAGQFVAIKASSETNSLRADQVNIRHEVVGPVSAVGLGQIIVAGQIVLLSPTTRGTLPARAGGWVAVSGLLRPNGMIEATRIDPARPGQILLHGVLDEQDGHLSIGGQILRLPAGMTAPPLGSAVTVRGQLRQTVLRVSSLKTDLLYSDPSAYFGGSAKTFLLQAYGTYLGNTVLLPGGLQATMPQGAPFDANGRPAIYAIVPEGQNGLKLSGACIVGPGCGADGMAMPNLNGIGKLYDGNDAAAGMPVQPQSNAQDFGMGHTMPMEPPGGMSGFGGVNGGGGFGQPPR